MNGRVSPPIRLAVLTVSDRCARGEREDASGPALIERCRALFGAALIEHGCVPDDPDLIERRLREWIARTPAIDLILTTGGTGLAPRDHTPEAALRVIERAHPALLELARLRCLEKTPRAFLTRGVAGAAGRSLIITLPGSPRGATENLEAIGDVLSHAIETLRGDVVDG
jgi:molybdenum cofactor synthesis domain-containing protein